MTLSVLGGSYFRLSRQADELVRRSLQFELISALLLLNALSRTEGEDYCLNPCGQASSGDFLSFLEKDLMFLAVDMSV